LTVSRSHQALDVFLAKFCGLLKKITAHAIGHFNARTVYVFLWVLPSQNRKQETQATRKSVCTEDISNPQRTERLTTKAT
jgi:hypothetical protein